MRTRCCPDLWRNITENAKHREAFRLFEIGLEIHKRSGKLPDEIPHLVGAIYERAGRWRRGLFELKRAAECLMPGAQSHRRRRRVLRTPGARRRMSSGAAVAWAVSSNCIPRWSKPDARPCSIWTCV